MSFWGKLAKIALKVAPIAAMPFTGGLSGIALGAGLGAADGLVEHKGLGGILGSAALGAVPSAAGKLVKGTSIGARMARSAVGLGANAAVGGRGGQVTTGYDPGSATDGGSVWDDAGNYIGASSYSTSDGSSGSDGPDRWGLAADIGAGAIKDYLGNKSKKDDRKADMARAELNVNPYRDYLDQAGATGQLDMMANSSFTPPPTRLAGRYGAQYGDVQPGPSYTPSAETRGTAAAAMRAVAAGQRTPTMTDPSNYGKIGGVSFTAPPGTTAAAPPLAPPNTPAGQLLARALARRRLQQAPGAVDQAGSPSWLA
jgi:hypothetical protein